MSFDREIWKITKLPLQVSAITTGISLLIGLPFGTWLALGLKFRKTGKEETQAREFARGI